MARWLIRTMLTLTLALALVVSGWANEQKETRSQAGDLGPAIKDGPGTPMGKAVQATLTKFDKGNPRWKVRMESLVGLVKIGPEAVPVLVEALRSGSPSTREFAAQALVLFADSTAKPALERALADPKP